MKSSNSLRQDQQLTLRQHLTPLQVRYVRMLEMSAPELEEQVRRAADEMPALEVVNPEESISSFSVDSQSNDTFNETSEQLQMADYASTDDLPSYRFESSGRNSENSSYLPIAVSDEMSVYEMLLQQLNELKLPENIFTIAREVAGNIDSNGYLSRSSQQIADDLAINSALYVNTEQVDEAISIIQSLDPAGIGARNLQQSLSIQLKRLNSNTFPAEDVKVARTIVDDYFNLLSLKHFDVLKSRLGITSGQLSSAMDVIRSLNPKPGASSGDSQLQQLSRTIIPDAFLEVTQSDSHDGSPVITVSLNNRLPDLAIERSFSIDAPIPSAATEQQKQQASAFIRSRRDEAAMFIKALQLRQQTLMSVLRAIASLQKRFFITGENSDIRPMVLRDVADVTGLDLSTVSRATAGKYIDTPHGVYPLKYFFNERTANSASSESNADDLSAIQISDTLRRLIENEDKRYPHTDAALTQLLAKEGLDLARRTVAKYRERLGFPVARLRREI